MQTTPQIDFQGLESSPALRARIEQWIGRLEKLYGRTTACRVVVKAPGGRHRTGGLFEVNVHIALPDGREVRVERTPPADERFQDAYFAVNEAFKHARRQLQDQVKRMRGFVKTHETQPIGVVAALTPDHGFIHTPDEKEVYFHRNSVLNGDWAKLEVGSRVAFAEEMGVKGPQASSLRLMGK